jgi:hypothetical protein
VNGERNPKEVAARLERISAIVDDAVFAQELEQLAGEL